MIDFILRWSLSHRVLVLALAVLLLGWGGLTVRRMPVDVLPDLTAPSVTVVTEAHGMAPLEVEQRVTAHLEAALGGAPGVRRVRSTSGVGISLVHAEFGWEVNVREARQAISERLQTVRGTLPAEVEPPILAPVSSVMGEILFLAVTSGSGDGAAPPAMAPEAPSPAGLRTWVDGTLRRRLLAVPGVAQAVVTGGDRHRYEIALDPRRLAAEGVTTAEVARALEAGSASASAGFVVEGGQEYLVHGTARIRTAEELGETLVRHREGAPLLVRHLGAVRLGVAVRQGEGSFNAQPAVIIGVMKQPGVNTLELTARLDTELDALERSLPPGMALHRHVFRQASFIEVAVANVRAVLRDGVLLVLVVVILLLGSARASVVTLLAIPLSLVTAVLALSWQGATLDTMTLGGMAIAVGELVDDAIIDVENVLRRLRLNAALPEGERRPSLDVVLSASREIRASILFATLVVVVVFAPLFFLSGVEGRLLRPLGVAYVTSLVASLLVAVTVTPVLASYLLPGSREVSRREEPRVAAWLLRRYRPWLERAIARWRWVVGGSVVAMAGAVAVIALGGRAFLPEFREGSMVVGAVTLPGTALAESSDIGLRIEKILLTLPEVASVARRTGRAEQDEHAQGSHASELEVALHPGGRPRAEWMAELRAALGALPGTTTSLGQPISHRIDHLLSGTRSSIAVKVFGDDLGELAEAAAQVEVVMRAVPGVVDVAREQQSDIPLLRVDFDREALARHGFSAADAALALEVGTGFHEAGQVQRGPLLFDLGLTTDPSWVARTDDVADLPVVTPSGATVPLHALGRVRRDRGPGEIGRENGQRRVVVACNVEGRDVVSVVDEIRAAVDRGVPRRPGQHIAYGGQFESAESALRTLTLVGLLCLLAMLGLVATALGSWRDAVLVLLNLPLALIGGTVGIALQGGVLSVASLVGLITLFGIATRNGIMLVSHVRNLVLLEGVRDLGEAVRRGARERLLPILMTALAAGLGLVPLALSGHKPGSEIQAPMALVILCGLATSTALNMFVVPALYLRFGGRDLPVRRDGPGDGAALAGPA